MGQIIDVNSRVRMSSAEIVAASPKALDILRGAEERLGHQVTNSVSEPVSVPGVRQSTSLAVNQQALATLLDRALQAGKEHLATLEEARQIGLSLGEAFNNPGSLTLADARDRSSGKGNSLGV